MECIKGNFRPRFVGLLLIQRVGIAWIDCGFDDSPSGVMAGTLRRCFLIRMRWIVITWRTKCVS